MSRPSIPLIDRSDKIGKYSVVELLFMGVSSVFRQTFNFIDVKIYYKTDYKQKYYIKGWHLPIYSFYVWGCKQRARNADEWCNRWDLTVGDESLTLLMSCRRVPLVHELRWLSVGWSKLANRAERIDRSSPSIERTSGESSTTTLGWTYQKAEFVDKHSSSQYNRINCFLLQVPQTFYLSATTKQRGFIHDYNVSFQHSSNRMRPMLASAWGHL